MFLITNFSAGCSLNFDDRLADILVSIIGENQYEAIEKQSSLFVPHIIKTFFGHSYRSNLTPFLLGGDHLVSYYSILKTLETFSFSIVLFDAHDDSYKNTLNHYSLFYHLKSKYKIKIYHLGCRQDGKHTRSILDQDITENVYISIDADFFSPTFIPSVNHPITCSNPDNYSIESVLYSMSRIKGKILAVDFVEWKGASIATDEYSYVRNLICKVYEMTR